MKLTSNTARLLAASAITCTAIVLPAAALASAGSAAPAGSPASAARHAHPVIAYVVNHGYDRDTCKGGNGLIFLRCSRRSTLIRCRDVPRRSETSRLPRSTQSQK